jgi:hypothetical protein
MSLFETLKKAIFHNPMAKTAGNPAPTGHSTRPASPATSTRAPASTSAGTPGAVGQSGRTAQPPPAPTPSPATSQPASVDVEAVLEGLSAKSSQKLNWRTSIVDLMKLVNLDSSLEHRKQLATELGYTGDMNDSAAMNIWLHKAVMRKLAENGGRVPASLQ